MPRVAIGAYNADNYAGFVSTMNTPECLSHEANYDHVWNLCASAVPDTVSANGCIP